MAKLRDISNKNGPFVDVWDSGDSISYTLLIVNDGTVSWVAIDGHNMLSYEKKRDGTLKCMIVINPHFVKILWELVRHGSCYGEFDGRKYRLSRVSSYDDVLEFNVITVEEYLKIQTFGLL